MNYKHIFGALLMGALLFSTPHAALAKDNDTNGKREGWFKHLFSASIWKNLSKERSDELYAMCKNFIAQHDNGTTPPAADTTDPVISALAISNVTSSSATLTWTTDESTRTQVSYGKTAWYNLYKDDTSFSTTHSMTLTGLAADTTYHFRVRAIDAAKNTSVTTDKTFKTAAVVTASNPVISNIMLNDVTGTSASVEWKTNEPTRSVLYWSTTSPINKATTLTYNTNSTLSSNHAMTINGLTVGTKYYFLIQSTDDDGNAIDATGTFTTAS